MKIDEHIIRRDTPFLDDQLFFNSAGSSLIPQSVYDKMNAFSIEEQKLGGYAAMEAHAPQLNSFYATAAKLVGCRKEQVAFVNSASDGYFRALSSIDFQKGDVVYTTSEDYVGNYLAFTRLKERFGICIEQMPENSEGIRLNEVRQRIKQGVKLVAVTHIPSSNGRILPVESIGEMCEEFDTLYLVDACQSVGQLSVDVGRIKCDFLTATGRKFLRGPRGTGFLVVSEKILEKGYAPLFVDLMGASWTDTESYELRSGACRFEYFEFSRVGMVGLTASMNYLMDIGVLNVQSKIQELMHQLKNELEGSTPLPTDQMLQAGIFTFQLPDNSFERVKRNLLHERVRFSVANKENSLLDMRRRKTRRAFRFSPHYFNTPEEVSQVSKIIRDGLA